MNAGPSTALPTKTKSVTITSGTWPSRDAMASSGRGKSSTTRRWIGKWWSRSLRQFDLKQRLMPYPCSYMIYSPLFDGLPTEARDAIYRRMWEILSGAENGSKYRRLSAADRVAIVEILQDTR